MTDRDPILIEREGTHGLFSNNAEIWKGLWKVVAPFKSRLTRDHELALDMIFLKISRAMQQPNVKDHWDDIAGYAKLGAEACE